MAFREGAQTLMRLMEVLLLVLGAAVCLGGAHAAAPSEAQILLNFKSSISDGGGGALANWSPADASPCNWTGVRCSSAGVVTELSLKDLNVSGTVPIGLGEKLHVPLALLHLLLAFSNHIRSSTSRPHNLQQTFVIR
jgi:hypothetical protein